MIRFIVPLVVLFTLLTEGAGYSRPAFDQEKCSLCHIKESVFFNASFLPPDGMTHLGQVVVCLNVAEVQAEENEHSINTEVAILIAHGVLHLLGYDHEKAADTKKMQVKEAEILAGIKSELS